MPVVKFINTCVERKILARSEADEFILLVEEFIKEQKVAQKKATERALGYEPMDDTRDTELLTKSRFAQNRSSQYFSLQEWLYLVFENQFTQEAVLDGSVTIEQLMNAPEELRRKEKGLFGASIQRLISTNHMTVAQALRLPSPRGERTSLLDGLPQIAEAIVADQLTTEAFLNLPIITLILLCKDHVYRLIKTNQLPLLDALRFDRYHEAALKDTSESSPLLVQLITSRKIPAQQFASLSEEQVEAWKNAPETLQWILDNQLNLARLREFHPYYIRALEASDPSFRELIQRGELTVDSFLAKSEQELRAHSPVLEYLLQESPYFSEEFTQKLYAFTYIIRIINHAAQIYPMAFTVTTEEGPKGVDFIRDLATLHAKYRQFTPAQIATLSNNTNIKLMLEKELSVEQVLHLDKNQIKLLEQCDQQIHGRLRTLLPPQECLKLFAGWPHTHTALLEPTPQAQALRDWLATADEDQIDLSEDHWGLLLMPSFSTHILRLIHETGLSFQEFKHWPQSYCSEIIIFQNLHDNEACFSITVDMRCAGIVTNIADFSLCNEVQFSFLFRKTEGLNPLCHLLTTRQLSFQEFLTYENRAQLKELERKVALLEAPMPGTVAQLAVSAANSPASMFHRTLAQREGEQTLEEPPKSRTKFG